MKGKIISNKLLFCLSIIPFFGFLIGWIFSWINIYKATGQRKYVALHYILWIIPIVVINVALVFIIRFISNVTLFWVKTTLYLIAGYIDLVLLSFSAIIIQKKILEEVTEKGIILDKQEKELL